MRQPRRSRPSLPYRLARAVVRLAAVIALFGAGGLFVAHRPVPFLPFARAAAAELTQSVTIKDGSLSEISGCAVSVRNPGVLWVHNDSGDEPNLYAIRLSDGVLLATVRLTGAKAKDWEDMTISNGRLLVGDIGDNAGTRKSVRIYSVTEPTISLLKPDQILSLKAVTTSHTYPSGPRDAEALLVDPAGVPLIIDKLTGGVWNASGSGPMEKVANLGVSLVTGADLIPRGGGVLVRTYPFVYRLQPTGAVFSTVWKSTLSTVPSPLLPQAEAVCAGPDGSTGYTLSEARGKPVRIVAIRW